jgi:putative flippase GtrA
VIARFGIVGLGAATVHAVLFMLLVEGARWSGAAATPVAFLCAFIVSYLGQSRWTFRADHAWPQFARYAATALVGLGLNVLAAWSIVDIAGWPPAFVLPFALGAIPALTFVMMRLWVFRRAPTGLQSHRLRESGKTS